jgi:hypothetical protein
MGRVAKYKKIKSCDPFSKKNGGRPSMLGQWGMDDNGRRAKKRSAAATALRKNKFKRQNRGDQEEDAFDLPPSGGDEFDLRDLLRVKKIKPPPQELLEEAKLTTKTVTVVPNDDSDEDEPRNEIVQDPMLEEKRANRILKIHPDRPSHKDVPKVERFPGESRKAFERRIKSETRQLIKNEKLQQRNPEKRQRKKEFLNKKKKLKGKSLQDSVEDDGYRGEEIFESDGFVTGEHAVARVALGDQVERPPVFHQLPRGAIVKAKTTTQSSKNKNASIVAEQQAIENMRRKVQAQYALVQAKRRQAGDFHL